MSNQAFSPAVVQYTYELMMELLALEEKDCSKYIVHTPDPVGTAIMRKADNKPEGMDIYYDPNPSV